MSGENINLLSNVWPDRQASPGRLTVKLRLATVCDQVNFEAGSIRLVEDAHEFLFTVDQATDFGKRPCQPNSLHLGKIF